MAKIARLRTRDDPEVRREQILDEAIRIIGQRGYYGFTVQELAQRCGLSNAGLLYHFGSKDQLLVAVVDELERREAEVIAPLVAQVEQKLEHKATSAAVVRDLLHTMVARAITEPELGRLMSVLLAESLDRAHPAYKSFRNREAIVLDLFAKLLTPFVTEPRSTARQLSALIHGLGQQWLRADQAFDILTEWDRALATLLPEPAHTRAKRETGRLQQKPRSVARSAQSTRGK